MRAGSLDHRWTLLERKIARDKYGEEIEIWEPFARVWGSWEPLKGSEKWTAQQFQESAFARIRLRHKPILTAEHRIESTEHGRFEIVGTPEHRRRDGETVIHVKRHVGDA